LRQRRLGHRARNFESAPHRRGRKFADAFNMRPRRH
jgi:hypothetical protein